MAVNYVKFQRGSQEAYNALKSAGRLDEDTLYFIYNTSSHLLTSVLSSHLFKFRWYVVPTTVYNSDSAHLMTF